MSAATASWWGLDSGQWAQIGPDNRAFVAKQCRKHGELGRPMAVDYLHRAREDAVQANRRLRELSQSLELGQTGLTATVHDGELKAWCERHAKEIEQSCEGFTVRFGVHEAVRYARKRVAECGLVFPCRDAEDVTDQELGQAMARVFDPKWWRLQVRRIQARKIEAVAREIRLVHKQAGIYASNVTVNRRKHQRARNFDALDNMEAVNDEGQVMSLVDCARASVSNPVNRRAELMVRIKGFEQCAETAGHVGLFVTLTAPSKYHRMTYIKSWGRVVPNKKYQGYDPSDAQAYFCRVWSQIRAQLWREDIRPYGFRVAEPHHDGTPHWHLLLFVDPDQARRMTGIIDDYGTREDGREWGASRQRVKVVNIDPDKGSAAGYIAKYISKNIDGHGLDEDLYGQPAEDSARRIDAWAAAWGIRQFQQIGGASVTVWRELRRLKVDELTGDGDAENAMEVVEAIQAADASDWAAYTMLQGGMTVKRDEQLIRSQYQDDGLGRYYQPVKRLVGVVARGFGELVTRATRWAIQPAGTDAKQQERLEDMTPDIRYRHGTSLKDLQAMAEPMSLDELHALADQCSNEPAPAGTWTRVNNCTPPPGGGRLLTWSAPPGGESIAGGAGATTMRA